jgi:hypothetical protein
VTTSPSRRPRITRRDRLIVAALALVGAVTAAPGVHLFERVLRPVAAIVVSHGIAVTLIAMAVYQWRVRRARAAASVSPSGAG